MENQLTFPHDLKNNFDQVTILGPKNNNNNNNNEEEEEAELTSLMREQWLLVQTINPTIQYLHSREAVSPPLEEMYLCKTVISTSNFYKLFIDSNYKSITIQKYG